MNLAYTVRNRLATVDQFTTGGSLLLDEEGTWQGPVANVANSYIPPFPLKGGLRKRATKLSII